MNIINGLTNAPNQTIQVSLEDGSVFTLNLYYRPQQNGWFFDVIWPGSSVIPIPFSSYNRRLVASPNVLRQFRQLIDFGILVATPDNSDPNLQTAFVDGSTVVTLLNAADVTSMETNFFPGS